MCVKVQKLLEQDNATAKVTMGETPAEYCPGVWDAEPHVEHDLEQYRVTHFTIYFDPLEKVHRVSRRV